MIANTVTINRGFSGQQYVRQVDGSWMAPIGSPGVLTQAGSRFKTRDTCHHYGLSGYTYSTSRRWNQSGVSFSPNSPKGRKGRPRLTASLMIESPPFLGPAPCPSSSTAIPM
jgi:hypothetical protein